MFSYEKRIFHPRNRKDFMKLSHKMMRKSSRFRFYEKEYRILRKESHKIRIKQRLSRIIFEKYTEKSAQNRSSVLLR